MVYLVEAFRPRDVPPAGDAVLRARTAASRARAVRLIGRLVVPADEVEFWLFDAEDRDELTVALAAARIDGSRISLVDELTLLSTTDRGTRRAAAAPTQRNRSRRHPSAAREV